MPPQSQNRMAVPIACGTDSAATASRVSTTSPNASVSRLPIPRPATAAIAEANRAVPKMNR
jgi:hypothetical protein